MTLGRAASERLQRADRSESAVHAPGPLSPSERRGEGRARSAGVTGDGRHAGPGTSGDGWHAPRPVLRTARWPTFFAAFSCADSRGAGSPVSRSLLLCFATGSLSHWRLTGDEVRLTFLPLLPCSRRVGFGRVRRTLIRRTVRRGEASPRLEERRVGARCFDHDCNDVRYACRDADCRIVHTVGTAPPRGRTRHVLGSAGHGHHIRTGRCVRLARRLRTKCASAALFRRNRPACSVLSLALYAQSLI